MKKEYENFTESEVAQERKTLSFTGKKVLTKEKAKSKSVFHFKIGFEKHSVQQDERLLANREYGLQAVKGTNTPYPKRSKGIDSEVLKARLEATTSSSVNVFDPVRHEPSHSTQTFHMKRKLFDKGEFTICKGRKMSDVYHPAKRSQETVSGPGHRGTARESNFNEVRIFCAENNIKLVS
ncbi:uncharacterized protein LOC108116249 [Drosophila eugracilis]|uniref:uncharacterized protein LOC108116249 n=1 Tax=Drosophila eugracilis TaxID=29029 RepID=UPI001BDA9FF8|nr:uncharacterized protein LOC108116249 [Drosophila eugracilis]